jgi:predicted O-linked N-acetylglucosamine transferase (SPINDLY family)
MTDDSNTIARIEQLVRLGMMDAAEQACNDLLQQAPREHKAWFWLSMLKLIRQQGAEAEAAIRQALAIFSGDAQYWNLLSLSLRLQSRFADAETAARQALALGDASDYWSGLGDCLFNQQQWDPAAGAYQQALTRNPQQPQVWTNLGAAEHARGQLDAAEGAFQRSLALAPDDPNTLSRYALLLVQRGQIDQGIAVVHRILAKEPRLLPAWLLLGNAERLRDDWPKAEAAYRQALQIAPLDRDARYNLALLLLQRGDYCEAEAWARQLVTENPRDADAWTILGGACQSEARTEEALEAMRRSVDLRPNPTTHSKYLVALHYAPSITPEQLLAAHREWNDRYAQQVTPLPPPPIPSSANRRLRIGFIGLDFGIGPTGFLGLRALECLDRQQCSITCYFDRVTRDEYTARFQAVCDTWRVTIGLADDELAHQVRRDEIDVLVDLGGHVGRRLLTFARRPAPLQVSWLGYVGTTGLAAMDGLIADRFHVCDGEERWCTESVLRMPHDYICYGPPPDAPPIAPLPALAVGHVTFGCFNNPAKYAAPILDTWGEILRRVPTARLLLKYGGLNQPDSERRFRRELAQRGVADHRILIDGWSTIVETMARYHQVDLALDTQPYSGGLTTCEALWMGIPVITCPGAGFASRHSTSHVTNAGYSQYVARDMAHYVELAVAWAGRLDELAVIRAQMRDRVSRSPLCDGPKFAKDFLALLREAWEFKMQSAE